MFKWRTAGLIMLWSLEDGTPNREIASSHTKDVNGIANNRFGLTVSILFKVIDALLFRLAAAARRSRWHSGSIQEAGAYSRVLRLGLRAGRLERVNKINPVSAQRPRA